MNNLNRSIAVIGCAAVCVGGLIYAVQNRSASLTELDSLSDSTQVESYQLTKAGLGKASFAQLEAVITADAAAQFPNSRIELGSMRVQDGVLVVPVVFFGPNRQAEAFLYQIIPRKNSWKIAARQRLWSVQPSQITRGLRV